MGSIGLNDILLVHVPKSVSNSQFCFGFGSPFGVSFLGGRDACTVGRDGDRGGLDTTLLAFTLRSKTTELTNYLHYI